MSKCPAEILGLHGAILREDARVLRVPLELSGGGAQGGNDQAPPQLDA